MTTGLICQITDMIRTGTETSRFFSIMWLYGTGVTRGGGGVAFRRGGGKMASMGEETGIRTRSETSLRIDA